MGCGSVNGRMMRGSSNPEENSVFVEHQQHQPFDDDDRNCKEERLILSGAPHQSVEKVMRGIAEIHATASHVDQNRVAADHYKNECPGPELPDIDDEVKQGQQKKAIARAMEHERA